MKRDTPTALVWAQPSRRTDFASGIRTMISEGRLPPRADIVAERCRRSFAYFVRYFWSYAEPAQAYIDNWHIGAIADHLQAVERGDILRLIINIPPGHAKSLLVSVLWPAWMWAVNPMWRSIFASYADSLAVRDSMKCRAVIESPEFQAMFADTWEGSVGNQHVKGWKLTFDRNLQNDFSNTASGRRMATSLEGKATGERGDCVVVDDPLNVKDQLSKAKLEKAIFWWGTAMSSRFNVPEKGARIIIMQRLHERDLSGHMLAQGGYEHLCLPSEFEPARRSVTYIKRNLDIGNEGVRFWEDPRKEAGEILFPALFPVSVLKAAKKDLGSAGYAGQHGQNPQADEGGMFKTHWWKFYRSHANDPDLRALRPRGCDKEEPARVLPPLSFQLISLDAAFKGEVDSDSVSFTVWGWRGADIYLLDRVNGKMDIIETIEVFKALIKKWPRAMRRLVEDKANGPAIIRLLRGKVPGIIPVNPGADSKEARAKAITPLCEAGNVFLPEGAPWLADYVGQLWAFPRGANDDDVDSTSQALNRIMEMTEGGSTAALVGKR